MINKIFLLDSGVQAAAVNVICELARKNPKNYLPLSPVLLRLMNPNTGSSNNWVLIKIIKLFGCLIPHEPRLGKKLEEPLKNLINNTSAMSLLYECINTLIQVLFNCLKQENDFSKFQVPTFFVKIITHFTKFYLGENLSNLWRRQ